MMDVDQATLTARVGAQNKLLRALSATQSEHTARLIRLEEGQLRLEEGQQRHAEVLAHVEGGVRDLLALLQKRGLGDSSR
jgi:hypothetical protein